MNNIYNNLKTYGCVSVYKYGSLVNPHIKHKNDEEYIAFFDTYENLKNSPYIPHVRKFVKNKPIKMYGIWCYLWHYVKHSEDYIGEKVEIGEPDLNYLSDLLKRKHVSPNELIKRYYHYAMAEAIIKYGYDDIPEEVINYINDIHDLKIPYESK